MQYRSATCGDIELLVAQRLSFINADKSIEKYDEIESNCRDYFSRALSDGSCDIILAEEDGQCIGTGIVFYYDSVPSAFNITGRNAYITSLFVAPDHRRRGIGTAIMNRLLNIAYARGYSIVMLNASDMGKELYRKMGFADIHNGMILDISGGENYAGQ